MKPNRGRFRANNHQLGLLLRLSDTGIISLFLPLCSRIYFGELVWSDKYTIVAFTGVVLFYITASFQNLYTVAAQSDYSDEVKSLVISWLVTLSGIMAIGYATKSTGEMSRFTLGLWSISVPIGMLICRHLLHYLASRFLDGGPEVQRVVIVGTNTAALKLATNIQDSPWIGMSLKGLINTASDPELPEGACTAPLLGDDTMLYRMAATDEVDVVYITLPIAEQDSITAIVRKLGESTVSVFWVPDLYAADFMQGTWSAIGDSLTVSIIDTPTKGLTSIIKRLEDLIIATFALLLLALPMLIIAILVKLTSSGPVFYKQQRYGMSARPITVWKFRSMTITENIDEFVQATRNDRRVTRLGRLLRRSSLDELPQLFNVLMGEMSVVGPRPHAILQNEQYRTKIVGYMFRHKAKPGITGLAQINGFRGETETDEKMEQRIRYDLEYINNWSVWLDLTIIIKTPLALITNNDVY